KASALDISSSDISVLNSNGLLGSLGLDYSKEQAVIKAAKESGVTTTGLSILEKANTALASKLAFLPSSEEVRTSWDTLIESKPGEYGSYGYGDLLEALGHKKAAESYRTIDTSITEGVQDSVMEEYEGIKTTPASKAIEYGAYYAGGAVFGAATKGVKVVSGAAGKALVKPITGLAEKTGSKLVQTSGSVLVSSLKSGKIVDIVLGAGLVYGSGQEIASSYSKAGLQGATKTSLDIGLALGIGAPGFKKGYEAADNVLKNEAVKKLSSKEISKFSDFLSDETAVLKSRSSAQQLVYKERPKTEQKIDTYVYSHGRLYLEGHAPKTTVLDIMSMESKTSGRVSARARASVRARTSRGKSQQNEIGQIETPSISPVNQQEIIRTNVKQSTVFGPLAIQGMKTSQVPDISQAARQKNKINLVDVTRNSPIQSNTQNQQVKQLQNQQVSQVQRLNLKQSQKQKTVSIQKIELRTAELFKQSKTKQILPTGPDLGTKTKSKRTVSSNWGSRVKTHYVQDPMNLVLGGGKKRK
ncbi:MAG: hypothetical protein QG646_181, partial [Euryarchaeota archaeon]|nr:hypothetical protein [Euryarchaeota archaeon]